MKNIFTIFLSDFKRVRTNVVAIVVMLGLVILPSLYAWFNVLSNWDPYGEESTSKIKVAIASDDVGIEIEGVYFNMGDKVTEGLKSNKSIGWVFTDTTKDAVDGVYSGEYYAALIMPEEFTRDLISFLSDDMRHPEIKYYENQKKNAIAPKITGKAKTAVQKQVNATFISTLAEVLTKTVGTVMDTSKLSSLGVTESQTLVDAVIVKLESVMIQIESCEVLVDSFINVIDAVNATGDIAEEIDADKVIKQSQGAISQAQSGLKKPIITNIPIAQSLSVSLTSIQNTLSAVSSSYSQIQDDMELFSATLELMGINLHDTKEMITSMKENIQSSIDDLNDLKEGDSYQILLSLMNTDSDSIGEFMSAPVDIDKVRIYPIDNYGSAMAPFYSVLAIWFGSLILVAIIHVPVKHVEGIKPTVREAFAGRYIIFFLLGQLQALLTVLGDLFFVQIQCEEPFKLWLGASIASFTFTMIIYSLTFAFGNLGEAAAVVIMVIQVAGAGGTFPKEVLPDIYQRIYHYLPFTYAMDAMREAVGGLYENYYWNCLGHLLIYVPISVIIGLAGGKAFEKMNHLIEKNKEKSGVML